MGEQPVIGLLRREEWARRLSAQESKMVRSLLRESSSSSESSDSGDDEGGGGGG